MIAQNDKIDQLEKWVKQAEQSMVVDISSELDEWRQMRQDMFKMAEQWMSEIAANNEKGVWEVWEAVQWKIMQ